MQFTRCFLVCIVIILFLSCLSPKKDNTVSEQSLEIEQSNSGKPTHQNILNIPLSAEEVKELIYENDDYIKEYKRIIVFIEKVNFGIPWGDNWIVRLNDRNIFIYAINGSRIEKLYVGSIIDDNLTRYTNFDIMRDIPGTHIPNGTSSIGDFNGDGIDEIFKYSFVGMGGGYVSIWFYDLERDYFNTYCRIPFALIDPDNGPAPVEFMTYRGMYGFKVFFYQLAGAGGPGYVPEAHPNNEKWIFYTWDVDQREYVEVGEVIE